MTYDMVKFERGQVWVVRFKYPEEQVGHEQRKDRPWLVLSVGKFNKSSGMVTMVPITTRDDVRSPSQVLFYNDRGIKNVILCESVRTFDYSSGAYIFDYMGNISDKVLEKVDVAISIHLGLHYSPLTLKKLYDSMEAIIKSVGYMQQKADTPKFTDDDVLQFAEKLQMLAGNTANNEVATTRIDDFDKSFDIERNEVQYPTSNQIVVNTAEYIGPNTPNQDTMDNIEVKIKRIRWTPEKCKEFMQDCSNMPIDDIMSKWNIQKKSRYYSMKNYVANLLEEMK